MEVWNSRSDDKNSTARGDREIQKRGGRGGSHGGGKWEEGGAKRTAESRWGGRGRGSGRGKEESAERARAVDSIDNLKRHEQKGGWREARREVRAGNWGEGG